MKSMLEKIYQTKLYRKYGQFFQFCVVGGTNFLVSYITYYVVLLLFSLNTSFQFSEIVVDDNTIKAEIASVIAFIISVLNAYILNKLWVFRKEAKKTGKGSVIRFFTSYGMTFFLSLFLVWFWINVPHFSDKAVPFLNVLITTPLNFLLSKFFTFREKKTIDIEAKEA